MMNVYVSATMIGLAGCYGELFVTEFIII